MNKIFVSVGVLILISIMYFSFNGITGNAVAGGGAQTVVIDMKNWVYSPSVINVKADVPVRIYLTDDVAGCFRDLILPEMGISKYLASSTDYIEVTFPEGTYTFACSMYMGEGKIIAE